MPSDCPQEQADDHADHDEPDLDQRVIAAARRESGRPRRARAPVAVGLQLECSCQLAPENSLRRPTIQRARKLTPKVITNKHQAGGDQDVDLDAAGLGELQRDVGGDRARVLAS